MQFLTISLILLATICVVSGTSLLEMVTSTTTNRLLLNGTFVKYSSDMPDFVWAASSGIVDVSRNLNETFHVIWNTLFRITFQGTFWFAGQSIRQFALLTVNDYLILDSGILRDMDQLFSPNTTLSGESAAQIASSDYREVPMTRVETIYLPPGIYTFNVRVRCKQRICRCQDGMVTYELVQFENVGNELGGFNLTTLPQ